MNWFFPRLPTLDNSMQVSANQYYSGEIIFSEGRRGKVAYIIKEGTVEISTLHDHKKVLLAKLGPGSCFGEMAPILGETRSATATAASYTELYVVDEIKLNNLLGQATPPLRAIVHSLIKRLKKSNESVVKSANPSSILVIYAHLLFLMAHVQQTPIAASRWDNIAVINFEKAVKWISTVTGDARIRVHDVLKQMAKYHMVLVSGQSSHANIRFDIDEIIDLAKNAGEKINDPSLHYYPAEHELIDINELSDMTDYKRDHILRLLANGVLPDDAIIFRKNDIVSYLNKEGHDDAPEIGTSEQSLVKEE